MADSLTLKEGPNSSLVATVRGAARVMARLAPVVESVDAVVPAVSPVRAVDRSDVSGRMRLARVAARLVKPATKPPPLPPAPFAPAHASSRRGQKSYSYKQKESMAIE